MTIVSASAFRWRGSRLYSNGKIVGRIIADEIYPKMFRVIRPDGSLSDMANLSRARDAALAQALRNLNGKETALEGSGCVYPDPSYVSAPHAVLINY